MFLISKINPTSLGAIRNLKEAGEPFLVVQDDLEKFLAKLENKPKKEDLFIIPTSDSDNWAIEQHFEKLISMGYDTIPSKTDLALSLDKFLQYTKLSSHNINTPNTLLINNGLPKNISFTSPYILKPCFSGEWKTEHSFQVIKGRKAVIINNQSDLKYWINKISSISTRLVLQEIIEQKNDENYSFCGYAAPKGSLLWGFLTQKILQYPEGFGTAILCRTIDNRDLFEFGKKVIELLGVEGIFEIEFIRSQKDNQLYVIEINLRHWSQHRLSTKLGINITLLDYHYRSGDTKQVDSILKNARSGKVIWIDDIGYMIHCLKNFFHPGKCKFSALSGRSIEFSFFSLKDMRFFLKALLLKFKI